MQKSISVLSTSDNPFDPFDNWDAWYAWDLAHGYNTPGLLARTVITSDELSEPDQTLALQEAMNDIVDLNLSGVHIKLTRAIEVDTPSA